MEEQRDMSINFLKIVAVKIMLESSASQIEVLMFEQIGDAGWVSKEHQ